MTSQINQIAKKRMIEISKNSSLSIAPAANTELMKFVSENTQYSAIQVMKAYASEINRLTFEIFRKNAV